jgi:uncharacterized membrane protein YvbJ
LSKIKKNKELKKEAKKEPINNREKAMIIVIVVLILILLLKTFLFDGVRNLSSDEEVFKTFVEYSIDDKFQGTLVDYGIVSYKIVDIYMAEDNVTSLLRYMDKSTGEMVETTLDGRYNARVKKMILYIFPLEEFSITSQIVGQTEISQ